MIYLITFDLACVLFYFSNFKINVKLNNKFKIELNNIFSILGILLLSVLAGLRSSSVGVDVTAYVLSSFNRVSTYNSILEVITNHKMEIGYELLEYIISRFFDDVHWLHFFTQLIIISGVYSFSKLFKDTSNWVLIIFAFLCIYYNQSYNIVRQWLSISIYLSSIKYLLDKNFIKYYLICILSCLFHSSAIITFIIPLFYQYLKTKKYQFKYLIVISIAIITSFVFLDKISLWLIKIGVFSTKYEHYFVNLEGDSSIVMQILSRIPILLGALIFYKQLVKNNQINVLMFLFLIIDLVIGGIGSSKFGYVGRCSLYFGVWQCAFISQLYNVIIKSMEKKYKFIILIIFIFILILYWYYCYIYRGFSGVYPYISDVFSILNF